MAAAHACSANPQNRIVLIDRNNGLGKKVIISGGGRCNVTTGIRDIDVLLTKYPRGNTFLRPALSAFSPATVYAWFESHGVPLKTQSNQRVFPQSDDGHDIVRVFETLFAEHNVDVRLNTSVTRIDRTNSGFALTLRDHAEPLLADRLILTTGGQAYRATGSTGDGYAFAQSLGHTITPLAPSLNAFLTQEAWPGTLAGVSFPSAALTACINGAPSFTGPFLFTHKGITGPAVFALSSLIAFTPYSPSAPLSITINLFPQWSTETLRTHLAGAMTKAPKKTVRSVLGQFVPKSLVDIVAESHSITPQRRAAEIGKKDLLRVATWLTAIPLTIIGRSAGDEFVTAGGVETIEVDGETMESRVCPNLFFAGEVLNVDGFTGGFNLQASWATGARAGTSASKNE